MQSRATGKRDEWTTVDIENLRESYSTFPFCFPITLLERHGKAGCYCKAGRMGFSHKLKIAPLNLTKFSEITKAYLAGIIDGEGTITLSKCKWTRKHSSGFTTRPQVTIVNTDLKLLEYLKSLDIGGFSYDKRKNNEHSKQAYQWGLSAHLTIYGFLKEIQRYLVIKKDKAEMVMNYIKQKHPKEV